MLGRGLPRGYGSGVISTVTVSSKGQITLPAWARERLGVRPGSEVVVGVEGDRIFIERLGRTLDDLSGSWRHLGNPDELVREIRDGRSERFPSDP